MLRDSKHIARGSWQLMAFHVITFLLLYCLLRCLLTCPGTIPDAQGWELQNETRLG